MIMRNAVPVPGGTACGRAPGNGAAFRFFVNLTKVLGCEIVFFGVIQCNTVYYTVLHFIIVFFC